jgi:hypothetical protein
MLETAPARPLLHRLDQAPADAACPPALGHNQPENFSHATDDEELMLGSMNPADNFAIHFRDENDVLLASVQLFETTLHRFAIGWVTENAAELGQPGRICNFGSANKEIVQRHASTCLFKSPRASNFKLRVWWLLH